MYIGNDFGGNGLFYSELDVRMLLLNGIYKIYFIIKRVLLNNIYFINWDLSRRENYFIKFSKRFYYVPLVTYFSFENLDCLNILFFVWNTRRT